MTQTVSAVPSTPTTVDAPRHTVGVEPMTRLISNGSIQHENARAAVVHRINGGSPLVLLTDGELTRHHFGLADEAGRHAIQLDAIHVAPVWPTCTYCGRPDDECPDPFGHHRFGAQREQGWRQRDAAITSDLVVGWSR